MRISDWSSDVCSSDLARHLQSRVTLGAHLHELGFGHAFMHVDVCGALGEHGRLPHEMIPIARLVIVTQEHSGFVGKAHQATYRAIEPGGIPAREVGASRSEEHTS